MQPGFLLSCAALLAISISTCQAAPQNGFSINGGIASTYTANSQNSPIFSGSLGAYTSDGFSLGMDYQVALNDYLSLNPFLMTSLEPTLFLTNVYAKHRIIGLQLRYWMGGGFVGGHIGRYSEVLTQTGGTGLSTSGSGGGFGLVGGWENPDGGLYVMGQYDSASLDFTGSPAKLWGFRVSVGYRWK